MCKRGSVFHGDMFAHLESQTGWTIADKKLRIFDCYEVIDKIAWIWRVLALFPFTIQYQMGVKSYKLSKIIGFYSFIICIVCFLNVVYGLIHFQDRLSAEKITMTVATILIRSASGMLCMILYTFIRIFRHQELTKFMESISQQDIFLEKMGCRFHRGRQAKIIFSYVLASFLTMLWLMIYDLYTAEHALGIITWILWVMPMMGQVINLTIFVSTVALLGFQFRGLNEKIRIIVTRANASSPKVIVTSDVCAENLRLAAKAHYNICAVGKRINKFFCCDLIINVVTAFVILSSTLYYIFVEVQREGKTNTVRIGSYIHWELIHSVPIIIIVVICNWTTHQSNYAGKFIHEIRVEKINSHLYEAIKTFSLQLHHQKLEFTGGGLFPLNSTLLQAMVGNITTYLVILIQFHPSLEY